MKSKEITDANLVQREYDIEWRHPMLQKLETLNKEGNTLLYNNEKCLGCGLCVDICKNLRNALELSRTAENPGKTEILIKAEQCSTCGCCAINCPFGALEFKINGEKIVADRWSLQEVKVCLEKCMCCGRCKEACLRDAIEVNGKMMVVSNECTYCGLCEKPCPTGAIRVDHAKKKLEIDASLCTRCRACEQSCPWSAIKVGCLDCLLCLGETDDAERISHLLVKSAVNINEDKCIYCGRCEINCPSRAINVTKPFEGRISIETTKCPKDCTICLDLCPCDAIERTGRNPIINKDICIYCGACNRACPQEAIDFERKSVDIIDKKGHLIMQI